MNHDNYTTDPAPGTERLHAPKCQVCGEPMMNRTGLCPTCQIECMEIGKGIRLVVPRGERRTITMWGENINVTGGSVSVWQVGGWMLTGFAGLYFYTHIVVAIARGWL